MPNCVICGGSAYVIEDQQIKHEGIYVKYDVCETCGFTFKQPAFHVDESTEKTQYDFHQNNFENIGYVNMFKRFIAEAIDPFIASGTALDFGSGPGPVLTELLKRKGFDVAHYDPFYHQDKAVLEQTYDLITSTEVFEHFHTPMETIDGLVKRLNKHGLLIIMTAFRHPDDAVFLKWWYRRDLTHVGFFTAEAFAVIERAFHLDRLYCNNKDIMVLKKG